MRYTVLIRGISLVGFLAVACGFAGCSKPTGSITGKVTYEGKLVKGGNIAFHSTEGLNTVGTTIKEDGSYEIPLITVGAYKVCVDTESVKPTMAGGPMRGGLSVPDPSRMGKKADQPEEEHKGPATTADAAIKRQAELAARYTKIPGKYRESDTTSLNYTVVAGSQTYDIDLK